MRAGIVLLAGVAVMAIGMIVAFVGILVSALFLPGTWLILIGLLACAASGFVAIAARREASS